jgi:hypothetical protein
MVTFCLLGLVGLLPLGLNSVKASRDGAAATNYLLQITDSISRAQVSPGLPREFQAAGAFSNLSWQEGGGQVKVTSLLTAGGTPSTTAADQRFAARIQLTPPAGASASGTALVSVAWPAAATWDEGKGEWKNAQGSVRTWLIFQPNVP